MDRKIYFYFEKKIKKILLESSSFWVSTSIYSIYFPFLCFLLSLLLLTEKDLKMLKEIIWTSKQCAGQNIQQIEYSPLEEKLETY